MQKKNRGSFLARLIGGWAPERIFLFFALTSGLAFLFVNTPFRVADEDFHFLRAYQVSEGTLISEKRDKDTGGELPTSLATLISLLPARDQRLATESERERASSLRLQPTKRTFQSFINPALYFPGAYASAAVGMAVGRVFTDRPLALFYWGRIFNYLVATLIAWFAIRLTPRFSWTFAVFALFPMAVYERASFAPDGIIISLALYWFAGVLRLFKEPTSNLIPLLATGILLAIFKQAYAPLLLLLVVVPRKNLWRLKANRRLLAAAALLLVVLYVGWSQIVHAIYNPTVPGNDLVGQLRFTKTHPLCVLETVLRSYIREYRHLAVQVIGQLGWLNVGLGLWFYFAAFLGFLTVHRLDVAGDYIPRKAKRQLVWIGVLGFLTIGFLIYLTGMPVGELELYGIQGRYLIPYLPCFWIGLSWTQRWRAPLKLPGVSALLIGFVHSVALIRLIQHFHWGQF